MKSKPSKYKAVKTEIDGIIFDSKKEAFRYHELKILLRAGEIKQLELQKKNYLEVNKTKLGFYKADFVYREKNQFGEWENIVEDVKGVKTSIYQLKKKLLLAIYGIKIRET